MQAIKYLETSTFLLAFLFITLNTRAAKADTLPLRPIIITANYSQPYSFSVNSTIEYVFIYGERGKDPLSSVRIIVESSDATTNYPLSVVVKQKQSILSWPIPLLENNKHTERSIPYNLTSRTLCPSKYYKTLQLDEINDYVVMTIATASLKNISFHLELRVFENFFVTSGETRKFNITPSEPVYYGYNFSSINTSSSVLISVKSDSQVCMTFSIQNLSCPVFDLEQNIRYAGYWQTVLSQGGITVSKDAYPNGFFIVFVVNTDDSDCLEGSASKPNRRKLVELTINNTITKRDYIIASFSVLSVIVTFCLIYISGIIIFKVHHSRILRNESIQDYIQQPENMNIHPQTTSFNEIQNYGHITYVEEDSSLDDDIDLMEDAMSDKEIVRTKLVLSVCDLARKEPKILRKKSQLYVYYLVTIAIFYTAPVIQLVVTYQNVLHVTGNQDLCYYNFLCSHPLFFLSDFNHVFSNLGYILLGLLFTFIVYMRERYDDSFCHNDKGCGIPQHYGLFYAMGFALMMEGILSGSYHLCPNHSNFQFDTSFMYIISVLCMVKIYQNRHPDINAQAPVTFGVLAITILLALIGVLDGALYFWIIFTIIHLLVCLFLTAQIYYMGRWRFNGGVFRRMMMTMKHDARSGIKYLLQPLYWRRLLLLTIGNLCNLGLAIYGNSYHREFATYLLMIFMSNLLLYTFFYIILKLCHREKIMLQPLIYIILSFLTWGGALHFFIRKTISWERTPAESRAHNKPCSSIMFNFYDYHDIWHFFSALAMFFSFMVLLTLDDDLQDVHRSLIPVF